MESHCALALCLMLLAATGNGQVDFSYEGENGPEHWAEQYPKCAGSRQSPVDIQLNRARRATYQPLWLDYPGSIPWEANLTNNGHTALVQLTSAPPITLHGGPLQSPYVFQQLHYHWGSNDSVGSEHAVNSRYAATEQHMVFYKQEYGSPASAANHSDGFAVLTVLFDLSYGGSPVLPSIVWALQRVRNDGDVTTLDTRLTLEALLPNDRHLYFTYQGSLTTPPCDEAVIWIIFQQRMPVAPWQVAEFRTLKTADGSLLTSNRRPVQPLGDRTVSWVSFGYNRLQPATGNRQRGKARARHGKSHH